MKNLETLNSLLSKLSSVRATLNDEEQALLDDLILGAPDDVKGHLLRLDKDEFRAAADETEAHLRLDKDEARGAFFAYETDAHNLRLDKDEFRAAPDEAEAHLRMASDKDEFRAAADETEAHLRLDKDEFRAAPDETEAHLRLDKDEARGPLAPDEAVAHIQQAGPLTPPWVEIYFDPDIEAYQIKHQS